MWISLINLATENRPKDKMIPEYIRVKFLNVVKTAIFQRNARWWKQLKSLVHLLPNNNEFARIDRV